MSSSHRATLSWRVIAVILILGGVIALSWYMIRRSGGEPATLGASAVAAPNNLAAIGSTRPTPPPITPAPVTVQQQPVKPAPTQSTPTPAQTTPTPPPQINPTPTPPPQTIAQPTNSAPSVVQKITDGRRLIQQNKLVEGRLLLNDALHGDIGPSDAAMVRNDIAAVNEKLIFSPLVEADDPYSAARVIQPGEYISNVAPAYDVGWQFLLHINNIADARKVPAHARIKVVKGPFHVVVDKSDFRAYVYIGEGPNAQGMYVRSFSVGLGTFDSTPEGTFIVRKHSKLANPEWTNPRTGEVFNSNDPDNPIGEYWIGLQGADTNTQQMLGYGLHGTIDPQSIGTQASMGCVRFLPDDIQLLFGMLIEEKSRVIIQQ